MNNFVHQDIAHPANEGDGAVPDNENGLNSEPSSTSGNPGRYSPMDGGDSAGKQELDDSSIDLKTDMKEAVAPVKEALTQAIDQRRGEGADRLDIIAGAIKKAAAPLQQEMPQMASYVRQAGEWVERSASDVREQKFESLLHKLGDFARDQPGAAFGIAALSGFVLSRFIKSAPPPQTMPGSAPR